MCATLSSMRPRKKISGGMMMLLCSMLLVTLCITAATASPEAALLSASTLSSTAAAATSGTGMRPAASSKVALPAASKAAAATTAAVPLGSSIGGGSSSRQVKPQSSSSSSTSTSTSTSTSSSSSNAKGSSSSAKGSSSSASGETPVARAAALAAAVKSQPSSEETTAAIKQVASLLGAFSMPTSSSSSNLRVGGNAAAAKAHMPEASAAAVSDDDMTDGDPAAAVDNETLDEEDITLEGTDATSISTNVVDADADIDDADLAAAAGDSLGDVASDVSVGDLPLTAFEAAALKNGGSVTAAAALAAAVPAGEDMDYADSAAAAAVADEEAEDSETAEQEGATMPNDRATAVLSPAAVGLTEADADTLPSDITVVLEPSVLPATAAAAATTDGTAAAAKKPAHQAKVYTAVGKKAAAAKALVGSAILQAAAPAAAPSSSSSSSSRNGTHHHHSHHSKGDKSTLKAAKAFTHEVRHTLKHAPAALVTPTGISNPSTATTSSPGTASSSAIMPKSSKHKSSKKKSKQTQQQQQVPAVPDAATIKRVAHALGVSPKVVKTQVQAAILQHKKRVKLMEQAREAQAAMRRQQQLTQQLQMVQLQQLQQKQGTAAATTVPQQVVPVEQSIPAELPQQQADKQQEVQDEEVQLDQEDQEQVEQQGQQEEEEEEHEELQQEEPQEEEHQQQHQQQQLKHALPPSEPTTGYSAKFKESPQESPCFKPLLQPPFFNRQEPTTLNNAYIAMLLARYTYPTAFGINVNTNSSRLMYQELFRRKWIALGAKANTIKFQDAGGGPGARFRRMINVQKPEAHAIVLGTSTDVWIAYRGLTSVDSALTSDMRHSPTEAAFGTKKVAVHSGFYNGFRSIWPQVMMAVKAAIMQTEEPTEAKIYITGHSLGGAHALFTALKLSEMKLKNIGGVYLFGTPKIGQHAFLKLFNESGLEPITTHWWNELDVVPNLGTAGPWKRSHYQSLPQSTLHRIWGGQCRQATKATAQACPLGPHRCQKNINDHRAFSYVAKLQACVLQQATIADDTCMSSKVMSSM